jgi:putative toxin-antitoxin system antitoxin component (TIGR02293 family)
MKTSAIARSEHVFERRKKYCFERANEVFEDGGAEVWMNSPVGSLGGKTPLSLLGSDQGYQLVIDTLDRISFGIVS